MSTFRASRKAGSRLKAFVGTLALATGLMASSGAFAEKLTIIVGGMEKQIYLPAALTRELGYFKDEGLDVELINSRAGVEARMSCSRAPCMAWWASMTTRSTFRPRASS